MRNLVKFYIPPILCDVQYVENTSNILEYCLGNPKGEKNWRMVACAHACEGFYIVCTEAQLGRVLALWTMNVVVDSIEDLDITYVPLMTTVYEITTKANKIRNDEVTPIIAPQVFAVLDAIDYIPVDLDHNDYIVRDFKGGEF